ncbi:MAG: dTDP-4-dehydrorhamnose 3,5-epimerase [Bacteriovoracaceae bacterium]|jgi:dTDP-4-dehydrorhamnose 3,5-epimerase|nr:dTDP-4-dehydrorhamnose 3,5-epimerase [Bacteriovoracaceae bacterium]
MELIEKYLDGVLIIKPKVFKDHRGLFQELYRSNSYEQIGIKEIFVQDNFSRSSQGVLRGLHFQKTKPQGKLVSVLDGEVFDVAVDLRPNSQTFGQYHSQILSSENNLQMYIPPGFAHGFCVLSETVDFHYKCTDFYDPADEGGILWSCKELAIDWPVKEPLLSDKDKIYKDFSFFKSSL